VNLREQLERASGGGEAARHGAAVSAALGVLLLLVVALLTTVTLGASAAAHGTPMLLGAMSMNLLLLVGMAYALRAASATLFASAASIGLLAALLAVVVGVAAIVAQVRPGAPELVPVAFLAIVVSALYDRRAGLLAAVFAAVLIAWQPAFRGAASLPVMLVAGGTAALVVRPTNQRDQSYIWMLLIAAAVTLTVVALGLQAGAAPDQILVSVLRGAGATVVSVIGAMLVMPLAERFTGRETHLMLVEWGDLNRPLLQRLSLEAPGTYAHTIAIANLAEAAARAIGANALLARVGAYYHDIGKLAKPQYFVENQSRGRNPHDKLKPQTSASIIRSHIREGLELADAEGVPKSIRAFITEHHGTGTIAYFLEKAREREGGLGGANTAEFIYPGPVPQSIETAVVMLADGVEAATRALAEPTPERIREVIELVVRQRLEQGQLRDAPLTLRQLTIVKQEFARVLSGMYHARIDYPTPAVPFEAVRP
jgi:putative nucleotidyltransferase with HDIG domain